MNKWVKRGLIAIAVIALIIAGLLGIGYSQHVKAKSFAEKNGLIQVEVARISGTDRVMCTGSGIGMIIAGKTSTEAEYKYYPVCSSLFGDAKAGKWVYGSKKGK